jgi:flotillin
MLQAACQQFLGKKEDDIKMIAQSTLEGHQRAIMAHMTVEVYCYSQALVYINVFVVSAYSLENNDTTIAWYMR